jgi:hypothetical protein
MAAKNKKNSKKIDLLEMSNNERVQLIKGVKEKLRQKIIEAKLWQTLLEAENVTINGKAIIQEQDSLTGFCLRNELPHV